MEGAKDWVFHEGGESMSEEREKERGTGRENERTGRKNEPLIRVSRFKGEKMK